MPKIHKPRAGSLQFWPRKRAAKFLPSVNWRILENKYKEKKGLLGFICYKAGMARAVSRDLTPDSMTKNKQIILPLTFLECPSMRILSVRFYKNNNIVKEIIADSLDKELRRRLKVPKTPKKAAEALAEIETKADKGEFDNVRVLVYNLVKQTGIKKTPDIAEIALGGSLKDKLEFIKEKLGKELHANDCLVKGQLVDVRGLTKGKGLVGPVKRFGLSLRQHKSEKGRKRPGTLGPWHPARVTFRVAMAGQSGLFTRVHYNSKLIDIGNGEGLTLIFDNYGKINTKYLALKGSVQGPAKRQVLVTTPLRETKSAAKENFEIINLLK